MQSTIKKTSSIFVFQKSTHTSSYQRWRMSKNRQNQLTEAEESQEASRLNAESDCFSIVKNYRQIVQVEKIRKIRKLKINQRTERQLQSHFNKIQAHKNKLLKKGYPSIGKEQIIQDLKLVKEQIMSQDDDQNNDKQEIKCQIKMGLKSKKSSLFKQQFIRVAFEF